MNGIKFLHIFLLNVVCSFYFARAFDARPADMDKTTQEMAVQHGYPCENYTTVTEDGYILRLFRIPGSRYEPLEEAKKKRKQPLILQHGIIDSSDSFLVNESPALAYLMADWGFDVWVTNFRGNKYSRMHEWLSPDKDAEYWDFSADEVIKYDLKAIFQRIIDVTQYQKISYIGHSMGGGTLLAAGSRDPAFFSNHVLSYIGFSPSTRNIHGSHLLRLAHYIKILDGLENFGINEIFNLAEATHNAFSLFCEYLPDVCDLFVKLIADKQPEYDNQDKYDVFFNHYPTGTSTHQMRHLLQQTANDGYFEYQRHPDEPLIEYDLTKFPSTVPVAIFGGLADRLVSVKDTRWLRDRIQQSGALRLYKEYTGYGHLTYLLPGKEYQCYFDALLFLKKNHL